MVARASQDSMSVMLPSSWNWALSTFWGTSPTSNPGWPALPSGIVPKPVPKAPFVLQITPFRSFIRICGTAVPLPLWFHGFRIGLGTSTLVAPK